MSDYTNTTEGVSGKGLLVAVILMGLFILGVAIAGGPGELNGGTETPPAPATQTPSN